MRKQMREWVFQNERLMKVIVCVLGGKHCTLREGHACRQPVRISIKQVSLENKLVTMKPSFSQLVIKLTTIPVHLCSLSLTSFAWLSLFPFHFISISIRKPFSLLLSRTLSKLYLNLGTTSKDNGATRDETLLFASFLFIFSSHLLSSSSRKDAFSTQEGWQRRCRRTEEKEE